MPPHAVPASPELVCELHALGVAGRGWACARASVRERWAAAHRHKVRLQQTDEMPQLAYMQAEHVPSMRRGEACARVAPPPHAAGPSSRARSFCISVIFDRKKSRDPCNH